jgi:3-oxoadipate enol-lactonase
VREPEGPPGRLGPFAALVLALLWGCAPGPDPPTNLPADAGFVAAPGGPLFFEARGAGPAVILLHGANLDRRLWDPQFEFLAGDDSSPRVVRYDIRPFGRSPPATAPYSDTEELLLLLDHLGIETATLVGLSLGGAIAIDFALTHPSRVGGLVLVGPGLSGYGFSGGEERSARFRAALDAGGTDALVEEWLRDPYMAPAMAQPELAPTLRALARDNGRSWLPESRRHGPAAMDPPAIHRLGEIQVPTLIVTGERDVPDIQDIADLLERGVPGATRVRIPGVGHLPNLEAPEAFNRALLSFLAPG